MSRGGIKISFITHKLRGSAGRAIHQTLSVLISSDKIQFVNCSKYEIKLIFSLLFFVLIQLTEYSNILLLAMECYID